MQIQFLRRWEEGHSETRCPKLPKGLSAVVDTLFTHHDVLKTFSFDIFIYFACTVYTVSGDYRGTEEANIRCLALGTQRGLFASSNHPLRAGLLK